MAAKLVYRVGNWARCGQVVAVSCFMYFIVPLMLTCFGSAKMVLLLVMVGVVAEEEEDVDDDDEE